MMVAMVNGDPSATIISCNSPTNISEETDLIAFNSELSSIVLCIPTHKGLVVVGDMNDQIVKNVNHKFNLHNSSNRKEEHLTDFMQENRLVCFNTKFQKRKGKLWTYTYANNTKALTDCAFINIIWNNCVLNCKAYSFFEGVSSDHRIVMAKMRLSLRRNATRKITVHYDWSLLNNRDTRDRYTLSLRDKFDALQEISETPTPNDEEVCKRENPLQIQYEEPNQYQCPET